MIADLRPELIQEIQIFHPSEVDIFSEQDLINVIISIYQALIFLK